MKLISTWRIALMVIALGALAGSQAACADTYKIFNLGNSGGVSFYGMDDSENVVLSFLGPCPNHCYLNFTEGVFAGITSTPPALSYDNGTPCTPAVPPGGSVLRGICNNGRDAFTGFLQPGSLQLYPGLYTGSFPSITTIMSSHFGEGFVFMNGNGDIVIDDHFSENWYFFLDTTTELPEPSSVILFGTGTLMVLGAIRRRIC